MSENPVPMLNELVVVKPDKILNPRHIVDWNGPQSKRGCYKVDRPNSPYDDEDGWLFRKHD